MPPLAENGSSINELMLKAEKAEQPDPSSAIKLYNQVLKINPLQTHAYDRLMIIYRKEKNYKKELSVINSGIMAFQRFYKAQLGKPSKKVSEISEKLNKAFHLVDKKGISLYNPEPLAGGKKGNKLLSKK